MFEAIAVDHPDLSPARIADILSAYPDLPKSAGALALSRDAGFRMPSLWIAEAHCRRAPTFVYRFDHATHRAARSTYRRRHATELPYVFGNSDLRPGPDLLAGWAQGSAAVSRRMQRRWVAFSRGTGFLLRRTGRSTGRPTTSAVALSSSTGVMLWSRIGP